MSIQLIIEPGKVVSWKEFQRKAPRGSIAIDGYVDHPTVFDEKRKLHNFDHHKGVNRLATRATCEQVRKAILLGLLDSFRDDNGDISIRLYANDCDGDICVTYFLLNNPEWAMKVSDPLLNRLMFFEDALDTTAGAYPFSRDSGFLRELEWILAPYTKARAAGILEKNQVTDYVEIIIAVEQNILLHLVGKGGKVEKFNTSYRVLGGGAGWSMVDEQGEHARKALVSDGIKRFVSVKEIGGGKWRYVLGKTSPYVQGFPIDQWYEQLNRIENPVQGKWGGSDTIGGSPRGVGSTIAPHELEKLINEWRQLDENP